MCRPLDCAGRRPPGLGGVPGGWAGWRRGWERRARLTPGGAGRSVVGSGLACAAYPFLEFGRAPRARDGLVAARDGLLAARGGLLVARGGLVVARDGLVAARGAPVTPRDAPGDPPGAAGGG